LIGAAWRAPRDKEAAVRRLAILVTLATLLAAPASSQAAGMISALSVAPSQVNNGASATGTVSLAFADPAPTTVQLFSDHPEAAQVPQSVIVPAGQTQTTFTITTNAAAAPTIVQITAAVGNTPRTANLSVNPAPPPGPTLSSVSVTPTSTTGGSGVTGTVTFTGPMTDGANVQMTSSNPAVASVPSEVVVNAGAASSTFAVTTSSVAAQTPVTITATWFGIKRSTTLTVTPGAPAPADRVAIQQARCKPMPPGCLLQVQATSTNFNAVLTVYSESGAALFQLNNNGGGKYSGSKGFITRPNRIEVRSNFGGSAFATVTT
jgi:hypothetical protein